MIIKKRDIKKTMELFTSRVVLKETVDEMTGQVLVCIWRATVLADHFRNQKDAIKQKCGRPVLPYLTKEDIAEVMNALWRPA